jgi:hypothetical protein
MTSNSPELRQRIKEQSKTVADYLNKDPLWLQLRNHPSLFCLHPTPEQLAILLDTLLTKLSVAATLNMTATQVKRPSGCDTKPKRHVRLTNFL